MITPDPKAVGAIEGVPKKPYFYDSPEEAARAFADVAYQLTEKTGLEHTAAMYSVPTENGRVYFNGIIFRGNKFDVIAPFLIARMNSIPPKLVRYEGFSHTHTSAGSKEFSDFKNLEGQFLNGLGGDQTAAILAGVCFMIDSDGNLYATTRQQAIDALSAEDGLSEKTEDGKYKYKISYGHYTEGKDER